MARRQAYAHSENCGGIREPIRDHLRGASDRAAEHAAAFGAEEQGSVAGMLHDIDKHSELFLRRLDDPYAPPFDHCTVSALLAAIRCGRFGAVPALAIQGHHTGLQELRNWREIVESFAKKALSDRFGDPAALKQWLSSLERRLADDGLVLPKPAAGLTADSGFPAADMLDVRMLFSSLVDADFIETEAHFRGDSAVPRRYRTAGPALDAGMAHAAVLAEIERVRQAARAGGASPEILRVRDELLASCLRAAEMPGGLFTLSSQGGSGKTLAMLAFATRHAMLHGLRRVVLVMPFLSIADQVAGICRSIFGAGFPDHYVIEDHSNARKESDGCDDTEMARLLSENWDAPVVLTTSVQCLESLMSDRPGACRKLHRLANSVVLFDEVQTLPRHLAVATLATLSRLSERFGTTVVCATATQPAFEHLHSKVRALSPGGWSAAEMAPPQPVRDPAKRVVVHWRHRTKISIDALAGELAGHRQVMCVVNVKRHARRLAEILRDRGVPGLFHLSTNMCPAHRMDVLGRVRSALLDGQPVCLVSTQCVEAGVDLSFPVAYRAMGPFESISQVKSRCNRHGHWSEGHLHVFALEHDGAMYPPGYGQAIAVTSAFLDGLGDGDLEGVLDNPGLMRRYYRELYELAGVENPRLDSAMVRGDFRWGPDPETCGVAGLYHLIGRQGVSILVPYDILEFDRLRKLAERGRPESARAWIRRARPYAASVWPRRGEALPAEPVRFGGKRDTTWLIATPDATYDKLLGWTGSGDDIFAA